ncbi:MAG: hypothetical protein ACM3YN_05745 [Parcubacteria group bacterium]
MSTFGFSAFLKLLSLNAKPQRWQVNSRLSGGSGGGYDFHRSLRLRIHRYLVDGESIEDLVASAGEITREAEQRSVKAGLKRLEEWRGEHPGEVLHFAPALYSAPGGFFKVSFVPDFGVEIDGRPTAIHVWNTAAPDLVDRMVYAALSLLPIAYAADQNAPEDYGVLSLQTGRLYRLSDVGDFSLTGERVVAALEEVFRDVLDKLKLPHPEEGDRPAG